MSYVAETDLELLLTKTWLFLETEMRTKRTMQDRVSFCTSAGLEHPILPAPDFVIKFLLLPFYRASVASLSGFLEGRAMCLVSC